MPTPEAKEPTSVDILERHSSARIGGIVTQIAHQLSEGIRGPHTRVSVNAPLFAASTRMSELERDAKKQGIPAEALAEHDEAEVQKFIALLDDATVIIEQQAARSQAPILDSEDLLRIRH